MSNLNLKNLKKNSKEILKAETGSLLFNLGKTHVGFWKGKDDVIHFDIDEIEFEKTYRYKPFSGYGNYYQKANDNSNSGSPFEKDLEFINGNLKDFFNKTEIELKFINNNTEVEKKLSLIDVARGNKSGEKFVKRVMFTGCENINSGIDKGAPKKQLDDLYIVNAFGTTKEEITNKKKGFMNKNRYDEARIDFLKKLWRKIDSFGRIDIHLYEMRKFITKEVKNWYSHLLSDSRFPANDVTLWDQAYMTASMFKASVAALCLDGGKYEHYMKYPRTIRWSILGVQYDKLGLAEKALNPSFIDWYRSKIDEVDEDIKKVVEEDYALGNEIYRDETGIYFVVPENICGEKVGEDVGLYRLDKELDDLQERVLECFKLLDGEVFPAIFVTEPSRGTMNIAFLIENAKKNFLKPVYPKGDFVEEYFGNMEQDKKFRVICDICKMRLANKDEDNDLNLCKICAKRQRENERIRINDIYKETIWTGELQDKNGRIALVTMKFELGEWLNGNMLNTMLNNYYSRENIFNNVVNDLRLNRNEKVIKTELGNILYKGDLPPASISKYTESILLERSIGDKWEKFLKDNLGEEKIDFQNRKIEWDKLNGKYIKFLSRILLQFVTRKNPSPARFRRIWETTEGFFIDIEKDLIDILSLPSCRDIRIKWEKVIQEEKHKDKDFEYKGLHFKSDKYGNLYLLSSIEKAISILSKYSVKERTYSHILEENTEWLKNKTIGITNLSDNSKCKIEFNNPKNITYKPYLSIINPTPISWQFIVPAEYVPEIIKETQNRYNKEFKYAVGKLPLHIGVVFQDYKKPLYVGIKALRNIRRDVDDWDSIKSEITGKKLQEMFKKNFDDEKFNCENKTGTQKYYSLYPLSKDNKCIKGDYSIYIKPEDILYELKSANNAEACENYIIYPNTIDFEYLDVNTRRNDIYYDIENSKRVESITKYKENRPYTWEEWESFNNFKTYFKNDNNSTKVQNMTSLIYSKLDDWKDCRDDNGIKEFMLSAFINTFELKDNSIKDDFAQIFGKKSWNELEGLCEREFRKELYKFLDMYEFWHSSLKER